MGFSWNLRKYQDGDEQKIVELLNIAFGKWHSLEYWKWRYKRNPAGSPMIWLAEHNNKIIGHVAIIPIRMKVGNAYMTGSLSCNGAIHPKHQGKGIFSYLFNKCFLDAAENNLHLTYGTATVNLGPTYKRYEQKGHICYMVNMNKVLDWEPLLSRYSRNKFLSRTAAQIVGKIHRPGRPSSANGNLKIERISHFDEKIDKFWEEISKQFVIIVKRDQRYLNWRYVAHPEIEYAIYVAEKDHRILGYCVLSERQEENLRIGFIQDILGFQDHYKVVDCLIQKALSCFKEHNVDLVSCIMSEKHPYTAIFMRTGFIPNPRHERAVHASINLLGSYMDEKAFYDQALILAQNPFLKEKRNWFMMHGDGS